MIRKIGLGVLAIVAFGAIIVLSVYLVSRSNALSNLRAGSEVANTSSGQIEYVLKGDEGPVVLFLHGSPGGYDQSFPSWPGYRLLAPSRPGYLRTPIDVGTAPEEQADAYALLLDELNIREVIVLGASGGGPSAIHFAAAYPERTRALILMEAVTQSLPNDGSISSLNRSDFLYWATMKMMLALQGAEGLSAMLIPDPANRERVLSDPSKLERLENLVWTQWPGSLRVTGWENDLRQINDLSLPIDKVSVPTLLIHGTADAAVPFTYSETLVARMPNAKLHAITGADHMMPLTHFDEIQEVSVSFLSGLGGVSALLLERE